jgi:hypothetical protein
LPKETKFGLRNISPINSRSLAASVENNNPDPLTTIHDQIIHKKPGYRDPNTSHIAVTVGILDIETVQNVLAILSHNFCLEHHPNMVSKQKKICMSTTE